MILALSITLLAAVNASLAAAASPAAGAAASQGYSETDSGAISAQSGYNITVLTEDGTKRVNATSARYLFGSVSALDASAIKHTFILKTVTNPNDAVNKDSVLFIVRISETWTGLHCCSETKSWGV